MKAGQQEEEPLHAMAGEDETPALPCSTRSAAWRVLR